MTSTTTIIHATSSATKTPGPGAYCPPSTFGHESPRFVIKNRYPEKKLATDGSLQALPPTFGTGHKHSFGVKHKEYDRMLTPGPNYCPPSFGSESPRIVLHTKPPPAKGCEQIGPLTYNDPTLKGSPRFTMKGRAFPKNDGEACSPGPAQYAPDYDKVLPSARRIVVKGRTTDRNIEVTPGPYTIPSDYKPKGIAFHQKGYEPKYDQTPGPAKYSYESKIGQDARKCAIRPRVFTKDSYNTAPYQKIPDTFGTGPKRSFGYKPKERDFEVTPGPLYAPPPFGSDMPKVSFHIKSAEPKAQASSPGPNYLPNNEPGKRYTMKGRNFAPDQGESNGPGPGKYLPNYEKVMPSPPKPTIHVQTNYQQKVPQGSGLLGPPPLAEGPKYTIGRKDGTVVVPGAP